MTSATCQYEACDRESWTTLLSDDPTTRWALCVGHRPFVEHAMTQEAYRFEIVERGDSDGHVRIMVREKVGWTLPGM